MLIKKTNPFPGHQTHLSRFTTFDALYNINFSNGLHVTVSPFPLLADVLSEEAILKWYKDAHAAKGKSVFLEQMKKFVEWLQNAEEGTQVSQRCWKKYKLCFILIFAFLHI